MSDLEIRPFRYNDLDAVIDLARVSFADEMIAQGVSQDSFFQQIRRATRGRMVPFRLLGMITGLRWQMFVAELGGCAVGCAGYFGERPARLGNLMVHPDYRRWGIGQALLIHRLHVLAQRGVPYAITTVLASNEASLGNLAKQGFQPFDRYDIWEMPLPYPVRPVSSLVSRPVKQSDRDTLIELEQRLFPGLLRYGGSTVPNYFPALFSTLGDRVMGIARWARVYEWDGLLIGGLGASCDSNRKSAIISRPLLQPDYLHELPPMLIEAANWVDSKGKTAVQVAIPEQFGSIGVALEDAGWVRGYRWVQLVKELGQER